MLLIYTTHLYEGSVALVVRVPGSRPTHAGWLFVSLDKALYSNCSVVQMSHKAVGPIWSTFHTLSCVKECHGIFKKSRRIFPGTVDRMSKYVTASKTRVGKGDCSPIKPPTVIVNTTSSSAKIWRYIYSTAVFPLRFWAWANFTKFEQN